MEKLKPCPFCGSEAESSLAGGYAPMVNCSSGECSIMFLDMNSPWLDDVEKKWNTRTDNNRNGEGG